MKFLNVCVPSSSPVTGVQRIWGSLLRVRAKGLEFRVYVLGFRVFEENTFLAPYPKGHTIQCEMPPKTPRALTERTGFGGIRYYNFRRVVEQKTETYSAQRLTQSFSMWLLLKALGPFWLQILLRHLLCRGTEMTLILGLPM